MSDKFSHPCWLLISCCPHKMVLTCMLEWPVICGSATFTSAGKNELWGRTGDEGPEAGADQAWGMWAVTGVIFLLDWGLKDALWALGLDETPWCGFRGNRLSWSGVQLEDLLEFGSPHISSTDIYFSAGHSTRSQWSFWIPCRLLFGCGPIIWAFFSFWCYSFSMWSG